MEVSGRTKSNQEDGNEIILCQPCQSDGDIIHAEGYCETCNEYFCSSCLKFHRKQLVSKNHVMKGKDEMPRVQSQTDPCSEVCAIHKTERIKFYCQSDNTVGCGDCMVIKHKFCKVHMVSDVSGNYGNSDELQQVKMKIEDLQKEIVASKHEIKASLKAAEEGKVRVIRKIKSFRREMNSYIDNVEAELIQEVEKLNANDVSQQTQLLEECETIENEMNEFQNKLDNYTDKINQLFVTAKLAQTKIKKCQKASQEIASRSQINLCQFELSKEMESLKGNHIPLGTITRQTHTFATQSKKSIVDMNAYYVKIVSAKTTDDIGNCWISGLAMLSPDEVLLVDYHNSFLKIINAEKNEITSMYETPDQPWDVTVIDSETVAATLVNTGKLLFVNTTNGLSESHCLEVRKNCRGIDHRNDAIAVSFVYPSAIQILNMTGDILHEVTDTSIFEYPNYIAFKDEESLFVSDRDKHEVYEITTDGQLKTATMSVNLKSPRGLSVTRNGTVIVCGQGNSGRVSMIVPDTREIMPLYVQHINQPFSIVICEESNKMFVSTAIQGCNFIHMFALK